MIRTFLLSATLLLSVWGCQSTTDQTASQRSAPAVPVSQNVAGSALKPNNPYYSRTDTTKLNVSDAEWKKVLSPALYAVAREQGTERAFAGKLWNNTGLGDYYCAACGNALFRSDLKFASDCGWPSFFEASRESAVRYAPDNSHGMKRIEVLCGRCDAHLGHLFDDGPPPTGKRFCMNSVSLDFMAYNPLQIN